MKKVILNIEGMTCSACSNGLEKYLKKQKGIIDVNVNLVMATVMIEYEDSISITLHGKKPDLYKDLLAEFSKEDKPNQFIKELMDSMAFEREVAEATVRNKSSGKYSEEEVEEIIANTAKELHDQHEGEKKILTDVINRGQGEITRLEEENEALKQKYDKLHEANGRLKNFVVHRIGKIPFLGRRVLKLMNAEVKALPETTDNPDYSERD